MNVYLFCKSTLLLRSSSCEVVIGLRSRKSRTRSPGAGTMHMLQPSQLEIDSLVNMVLYPLLNMGGGPSFVNHSNISGKILIVPVIGVSGVAKTGWIWWNHKIFPLSSRQSNQQLSSASRPITRA